MYQMEQPQENLSEMHNKSSDHFDAMPWRNQHTFSSRSQARENEWANERTFEWTHFIYLNGLLVVDPFELSVYDFSHGVDDGSEHDSIIVAFHAMEKARSVGL